MITAVIIVSLFALLVCGVPIGFAMTIAGSLGLYFIGGWSTLSGILSTAPLSSVGEYEAVSIPMFVMMAEVVVVSGVADDLFAAASVWVGRMRGGLAVATAFAGAGFAAISSSSTIGAATLAATSYPAMVARGYERKLANGVVAISGTLGMLIPPSLALILYSLLADTSIVDQLAAGIIPGLIVTAAIVLTVKYLVWRHPHLAPAGKKYTVREKVASLRSTAPVVILVLAILGSMFMGIATPSEASAVGAFGAFCIAFFRRSLTWPKVYQIFVATVRVTAMISLIVIGAHIFAYAMTLTQTTQMLISTIAEAQINPWLVVFVIVGVILLLGFFMDQFAIMVLSVPIVLPLIVDLGFDPVWFGVIMILTAEVGMVTPPVGMNVFVVAKYTEQPVEEVFAGVWPHVVAHLLVIILLISVPAIVLWPIGL